MKILLLISLFFFTTAAVAIACQPPSAETAIDVSFSQAPSEVLELTLTPEPTITPPATQPPHVDVSDGRNDGLSSCPSCTQAPVLPVAPPDTGLREQGR